MPGLSTASIAAPIIYWTSVPPEHGPHNTSITPAVFPGFTQEEKSEVLLDEKEAYKIVFSSASQDKEEEASLKILQYVVLHEDRVYFITYSAYPASYDYFLPFINTMLETFTFSV